jgi:hypothetical protein
VFSGKELSKEDEMSKETVRLFYNEKVKGYGAK